MDIHHLKIFISVFKNRSFSMASEHVYLSQPTISEHIKNLEQELDCKLFDRMGRTIIPTKEAEVLYPHAMQILEEMERLKEDISTVRGDVKGELIIGASTIPGTYILPVMASEFKRQNPEVSFQIKIEDSGKITDMVLNHELILGVVGAMMESEKLNYFPFVEDELILAASEGVINKDVIGIKEILKIPFVMREEGSGTRKIMENFLEKRGINARKLNIIAVLGSTDSVKQALKAGLGASILSRNAIQDELKTGLSKLKEFTIRGLKMTRYFYLITHKKRTLSNPYNAFYDYLKDSNPL